MGCKGGADRTFACKSQECLWQDWYISKYTLVSDLTSVKFGYVETEIYIRVPTRQLDLNSLTFLGHFP